VVQLIVKGPMEQVECPMSSFAPYRKCWHIQWAQATVR